MILKIKMLLPNWTKPIVFFFFKKVYQSFKFIHIIIKVWLSKTRLGKSDIKNIRIHIEAGQNKGKEFDSTKIYKKQCLSVCADQKPDKKITADQSNPCQSKVTRLHTAALLSCAELIS